MKKVAFIFPGQGAQYLGMGKELYDNYEVARQTFQEAERILNIPLTEICFGKSLLKLSKLEMMLPAIFTCSVATYRVITQIYNIHADFMAGHSLGEYSMLVCSGVIPFEVALKLIYKRCILAKQVVEQQDGGMIIAEGIDSDMVDIECKEYVREGNISVACYNSRHQVAICGNNNALLQIEEKLRAYGADVTPLLNSAPFHCDFMWPITDQFFKEIGSYPMEYPNCIIYSNVTGKKYKDISIVKELLTAQLVYPVKWESIVNEIKCENMDIVIEIGSKGILTSLLKESMAYAKICSVSNIKDLEEIKCWIYGDREDSINIDQDSLKKMITECMKIVVSTPNYCEDEKLFNSKVVNKYKMLAEKKANLGMEINGDLKQMYQEVLQTLDEILTVKKIDETEKQNYIEGLTLMERS